MSYKLIVVEYNLRRFLCIAFKKKNTSRTNGNGSNFNEDGQGKLPDKPK